MPSGVLIDLLPIPRMDAGGWAEVRSGTLLGGAFSPPDLVLSASAFCIPHFTRVDQHAVKRGQGGRRLTS